MSESIPRHYYDTKKEKHAAARASRPIQAQPVHPEEITAVPNEPHEEP